MRSRSSGGDARAFVADREPDACRHRRRASMRISEPAGAYFAALSRRLNSTCSNSTGSSSSIGRSAAMSSSTRWAARILAARSSALPMSSARSTEGDARRDRARFEPGHVEQIGDEAVEPLGLLADRAGQLLHARLRRGASRNCRGSSRSRGSRQAACADRATSRSGAPSAGGRSRRRSCARSRSSARLMRSMASAVWSLSASSRRRWSGVKSGPGSSLSMPTTPTAPRPVRIGRKRRVRAGQRVGVAAGGAVVLPAPFGRREIGLVEQILRRIAGAHRDALALGEQQHDPHLEHQRDLVGGRP